jgi:hypothetical protein
MSSSRFQYLEDDYAASQAMLEKQLRSSFNHTDMILAMQRQSSCSGWCNSCARSAESRSSAVQPRRARRLRTGWNAVLSGLPLNRQ